MTSPTSYFAAVWERWDRLANLRGDPPATPRVEPVDPPADVLAAFSAPPAVEYVPPSYPFSGIDVAIEAEVLDRLADLTVKGSPWEAARVLFGGSHA